MSLPREPLSQVFEKLDVDNDPQDKRDLYHCVQVCKYWNEIAVRVLYKRFSMVIAAPPSEKDFIRRYFQATHVSWMRELYVTVTAGGQLYTTESECKALVSYLRSIISIIIRTESLRCVELDLFAFTPADCLPNLWESLQPANYLLVELVRAVVRKGPELHIRLSRPDIMTENQVETFSHQLFNDIMIEATGILQSLRIGCRMSWLLPWLRSGNHQLREIGYTNLSSEAHDVDEFWDIIAGLQLRVLALDGFDFAPIHRFSRGLSELILTHLDDTVRAANNILTLLPNLRLLSLRLQMSRSEHEVSPSVRGTEIVCRGLRKAWWTTSDGPVAVVQILSQTCKFLDSISLPINATDRDLVVLSVSSEWLTELWMMNCPNITEFGFQAIRHLRHLKHLQVGIRLASLLTENTITLLAVLCSNLARITVIFNGTADETIRRHQLLAAVTGSAEFHSSLLLVISFQGSQLGDEITLNVKLLRGLLA